MLSGLQSACKNARSTDASVLKAQLHQMLGECCAEPSVPSPASSLQLRCFVRRPLSLPGSRFPPASSPPSSTPASSLVPTKAPSSLLPRALQAEKADKAAQRRQQQQPRADTEDHFAANYGDVPVEEIQSKTISGRSWTGVGDLDEFTEGRSVLICGAAQAIRPVSKKMAFFVLRQSISTVQCVLIASADAGVSTQMVHFTTSLSKESIVDVEGVVSLPKEPLKATTQQAEIQLMHDEW